MAFGDRKKKKYAEFVETVSGEIVYTGKHLVYDVNNPLPYTRYRTCIALACTGAAILAAARACTGRRARTARCTSCCLTCSCSGSRF